MFVVILSCSMYKTKPKSKQKKNSNQLNEKNKQNSQNQNQPKENIIKKSNCVVHSICMQLYSSKWEVCMWQYYDLHEQFYNVFRYKKISEFMCLLQSNHVLIYKNYMPFKP